MLVVRPGGARLLRGSRGRERPALELAANAGGYAALRDLSERAAPPPIHVLVDVLEEDFQHETVPHVRGHGRRGILATRSARLFHGTPYSAVRREGRERDGRRDDRVLFSAILRPDRLEPWLDALRGKKVAGVHSLPIASARLLPLLDADAGRVLLVTESGERGLRQTCFEDGRLSTSRLAPLPPAGSSDRARCIVEEIDRFVNHLGRSARPAGELEIRLVAGERLLRAVRELDGSGTLGKGMVDVVAVERLLGCRQPVSDGGDGDGSVPGCDRAFARLVTSAPLPNHYAPPDVLAVHRAARASRALVAAGALLLLAGTAWAGLASHRTAELGATADSMAGRARAFEDRHRAERPPTTDVAPEDIRRAVETAARLDAGQVRALPILRTVSKALSVFPDVHLEGLEWFEVSDRDLWAEPADEDTRREQLRIVHLRGRAEPFDGHHRAAAEEVFRLADELEALPRVRDVEVLRGPGETPYRDGRGAGFEMRMVVDAGSG